MNPLSRKLIFGDREQINAVNALINQNQKEAEEEEKLLSGELTWFDVELRFEGSCVVRVIASDSEDAKERAMAQDVDLMSSADIDEVEVNHALAVQRPTALK